jgi:DNA-directed RNA polymerase specialized sigma24 family protein
MRESVEELLAVARPHERTVIALRAEGFRYGEIARLLNVGPSAARMRMSRARERMLRHRPEARRFLDQRGLRVGDADGE